MVSCLTDEPSKYLIFSVLSPLHEHYHLGCQKSEILMLIEMYLTKQNALNIVKGKQFLLFISNSQKRNYVVVHAVICVYILLLSAKLFLKFRAKTNKQQKKFNISGLDTYKPVGYKKVCIKPYMECALRSYALEIKLNLYQTFSCFN